MMRMHMIRFSRLTDAFSKKVENRGYEIALHFDYYNFAKEHKTLETSSHMGAGLRKRFLTIKGTVNPTDGIQPNLSNLA